MNRLSPDIGYQSLIKHGEMICGDSVAIAEENENSLVIVLADGLGSGVKANILSTLTAQIISTMMVNSMDIADCVRAIVATLPVCEMRNIAYSTFTILRVSSSLEAEIIEYDNPHVIMLRNGVFVELPKQQKEIGGKLIYQSRIPLKEDDTFVAMSDGVIHAGVGKTLSFGWARGEIAGFLEKNYSKTSTAKAMTSMLIDACNELYQGEPGDDTTVCTVRIRRTQPVNLMLGPPSNPDDVSYMMSRFFAQKGKHIICGGTTSSLAADYLGRELSLSLDYIDPHIPPTGRIEGVDIVTEGVITINQVLSYSKDYLDNNKYYSYWKNSNDGASQIARLLFEEATDISFFVGKAINPAHQNPDLPIGFSIKMRLVEELIGALKKMGKRIKLLYF